MKNYFLVTENKPCMAYPVMRYTLTNDILLNHKGWERISTRSVEPKTHMMTDKFCIESEQSQVYGCLENVLEYIKNHPDEKFEWYSPNCGRVGVEIDEE
uniref:Uncharacterized protein n=1 Tax=Siphoviridae sp. ctBCr48 TaxID=2827802 RepID=A0A8S5SGZ6_9CAUD|nr:MAG TPA: hypothetical protein [Siphoviridae sp. ctBCr48]